MKKNFVIVFLMLVIALILTLGCGAAGNVSDQIVYVGQNGIYDLNSAVNALGPNAGNAVIYLNGSLSLTQQVEIPAGLTGLKSVTIASYSGSPVTVSMGGSVICANGVPLTVEQGVSLNNGFVVGGSCAAETGSSYAGDSLLIINGNADYIIGGGLAMKSGTISSVENVSIVVNGSVNSLHGGGYAYNGGNAEVTGFVDVIVTRTGSVSKALYGGGYAAGNGSSASVASAHVTALGSVGKAYPDTGLAENGGKSTVGSSGSSIEIVNPKAAPTAVVPYIPYEPYVPQQQNQVSPYPTASVIYIGPNQKAQNFTDAVSQIPANAGNVEFRIMGNFRQENEVMIPTNRGILSLTVTGNNNTRMTVSWPEEVGFYANGIPTTIAESVVFKNGTLYGGANVLSGQQSRLQTTYLDIAGTVNKVVAGSKANGAGAAAFVGNTSLILRGRSSAWLYGGGAALYGGYSAVEGTATMTVTQGATVDQSVAGGGYAFGAGSQSVVNESNMNVSGTVVFAVFLGGYADQKAEAHTTGLSYLNLQPTGYVQQSVWYGGRAYNRANVTLDTASAQISGRVGATVHREGRASDGGSVSTRMIR